MTDALHTSTREPSDQLGTTSLVLGVAGLLPILPILGSAAAIVCGFLAQTSGEPTERSRGKAGIAFGWIGLAGPVVALFVYCVVLGYPFPIHRYSGG